MPLQARIRSQIAPKHHTAKLLHHEHTSYFFIGWLLGSAAITLAVATNANLVQAAQNVGTVAGNSGGLAQTALLVGWPITVATAAIVGGFWVGHQIRNRRFRQAQANQNKLKY